MLPEGDAGEEALPSSEEEGVDDGVLYSGCTIEGEGISGKNG